jgi:ATP-binding cassette subfamily B protein
MWRTLRAAPAAAATVLGLAWRTSPRMTLLAGVTHVVSGCVTAFGLLATANVFTALLEAGPTPQRVVASLPGIVLVLASYSVRALLDTAVAAVEATLVPRVRRAAQDAVNHASVGVDLVAWEDADFRELVRQGGRYGVLSIETSFRQLTDGASSIIALIAAMVTAGLLDPWLAPMLLLAAIADGWSAMRVAKLRYGSFLKTVSQELRLHVVENLMIGRDVAVERHALTLQDTLLAEDRRIADGIVTEQIRLAHRQNLVRLAGRALSGVGTGLAYLVLGLLLYTATLPLALAGTAVIAMRTASSSLSNSMRTVNSLYEESFYIAFFRRLLVESAKRARPAGTTPAPVDPAVIELRGVSFTYPGKDTPAVDGVDLTIRGGEVIALVGQNGSGKTTLAKLISGLFAPMSGTVAWDGVDLATVDAQAIHQQIAVIAQEPARWPMTAANNVRIGRLGAGDEKWRRALCDSGADEVFDSLPAGGKTVLSKQFRDGHDLSGGQWQRVGVARGIYRDAAILIADEPTAALDAKAEARVFAGLHSASRRASTDARTTILVTHRLANIRRADRIVVLDKGRVVEQGTHAELIAARGLYQELYDIQASAYSESGTTVSGGD